MKIIDVPKPMSVWSKVIFYLMCIDPAAPGDLRDAPPWHADFAKVVGDDQTILFDGHFLESDVIPIKATADERSEEKKRRP